MKIVYTAQRIAGVILGIPFFIMFGLILLVFHPVQVICRRLWGYSAHKRSVDMMNLSLLRILLILGVRVKICGIETIPSGRPLIVVSNHQSAYDIPPLIWELRRFHPKFIAKKELSKFIPSISYNLRYGGSVLIDRKDRTQSVKQILRFGKYIGEKRYAAVIFPEGTRSRDGRLRKFREAGIASLLRSVPDALIVPFAIDGTWKMRPGRDPFPMAFFGVRCMALPVIDPLVVGAEKVIPLAAQAIEDCLSGA